MAQHDYVIANQTAPSFRSDLNNALQAIVTTNSGTTAPSTTYANMLWYETDTNLLKIRNEANTAWISLMYLDQSNNVAWPEHQATQAEAQAGTDNNNMMTPLRTAQAIAAQTVPAELEGWHPYDMSTAGDGNDGVFWQQSVNGTITSSFQTPTFSDGYDYAILLKGVKNTLTTSPGSLALDLYGATSASYLGAVVLDDDWQSRLNNNTDLYVEFVTPTRFALNRHYLKIASQGSQSPIQSVGFTTAQKVGRCRIRMTTSSHRIISGQFILLKRRNYLTG